MLKVTGPMAIKLGRRQCLWIACLLCAASNSIMIGTTSLGGLYAGRLLIGIANGFLMTFSQLYLQVCPFLMPRRAVANASRQEVSPAKYRGLALAAFQVWTSIGSLVGTIVDNFTAKLMSRLSYRIPLAIIYAVPCVLVIGMIFIPETPRWLAGKGRVEEARKALRWLRPKGLGEEVDKELAEIMIAIDEEKQTVQGAAILDMFRNPIDRRRTYLAVGAVSVQAACGAMYMLGRSILNVPLRTLLTSTQLTEHTSLRWLRLANPSRTRVFSSASAVPPLYLISSLSAPMVDVASS